MFLDSDDSLKQNTMTVIIEAIQKKENEFCDVFRIDTVSNNKNGCQKIYNDRKVSVNKVKMGILALEK